MFDTRAERGGRWIGIASRRRRIEGGFGDLQIDLGDVLLLAGEREVLREAIVDAGLLALMPQTPAAARPDAFLSVAVFAIGVASTALGLRSEEHTSALQSLMRISYAVFCLKKKK